MENSTPHPSLSIYCDWPNKSIPYSAICVTALATSIYYFIQLLKVLYIHTLCAAALHSTVVLCSVCCVLCSVCCSVPLLWLWLWLWLCASCFVLTVSVCCLSDMMMSVVHPPSGCRVPRPIIAQSFLSALWSWTFYYWVTHIYYIWDLPLPITD